MSRKSRPLKRYSIHKIFIFTLYAHATVSLCEVMPSPLSSSIAQPTITRLYKDTTGFLWVGTQQGLYKFEGSNVRKFSSEQKDEYYLSNSDIRGISQRSNGDIIIATFGGGILELKTSDSKFSPSKIRQNMLNPELTDLHEITDDYYLATSKTGIIPINLSSHTDFRWVIDQLTTLKIDDVVDVVKIDLQKILLASKTSLIEIDLHTKKIRNIDLVQNVSQISSLAKVSAAEVLLGTPRGKIHFVDLSLEKIRQTMDFSSTDISRITDLAVFESTVWIGTDGGLVSKELDKKETKHFSQKNSKLSHDYITKLFFQSGILLVGTYQGLDQIKQNSISTFNYRNSSIYNDVLAFTKNSIDELWVGTYNGIFWFNEQTGMHHPLITSDGSKLPDTRVMALASDDRDVLIGLQQHGLYRFDPDNNRLISVASPEYSSLAVSKILRTANNGTWIASYNNGVFKYSDNKLTRIDSDGERSFILLFEAQDGTIFAGSERELYRFDKVLKKFRNISLRFPSKIGRPQLFSINGDIDGNVFLGTKNHGIFTWKNSSLQSEILSVRRFGKSSYSQATIYGILFDEDGNLWCSTQLGILVLDPLGEHIFRLSHQDGLQADDFNFGAHYLDSNHNMYFGGVNGYNILKPRDVELSTGVPPVVITQIDIGNKNIIPIHEIDTLQEIQISKSDNIFSITINVLDFANPDQNRYTHILEGLDSGWVDDGTNNKITYTNLEPGDYVFRARGANSAGIWSEDGVSLKIKVLPPWWLTWWAYCLYSAILLIAIWGAMRIYREHLLKEEAIKNAGEMLDAADRARDDLQESHELQDNLVRAVHQHNVATLDLVGKYLGPAEVAGESRPKVLGQLKAMELLEKCFYFQGGLLMADVHTYVDSLTNYLLDLTPVDPAKITTINLTTSELLPATIASPAAVILYELLENSLLHAFTDDRAAQFIEIDAKVDRSMHDQRILLLSVSDDGIGLSATQSERSQNKAGLQIVRSLADSMGGAVTISQNDGSQFHVSLPMP